MSKRTNIKVLNEREKGVGPGAHLIVIDVVSSLVLIGMCDIDIGALRMQNLTYQKTIFTSISTKWSVRHGGNISQRNKFRTNNIDVEPRAW